MSKSITPIITPRKKVLDSLKKGSLHGDLWATDGCVEKIAILSETVQTKFNSNSDYDPLKDISKAINEIVRDIANASKPDVSVCVDHTGTSVDDSKLKERLVNGSVGPLTVEFHGWLSQDWMKCPTEKPVDKLAGQVCKELILKLLSQAEQARYVEYQKIPYDERPLIEIV